MTRPTSFSLHFTDTEKNIFYSFEHSPFKLALIYISKIADSTISAGVSKNSYSKARCICNASVIFVVLPSNLRNILDSSASFDIPITLPFYLKYPQNLPEFLFMNRKVYRYSLLFLISTHVRFTKTNKSSYNGNIEFVSSLNS